MPKRFKIGTQIFVVVISHAIIGAGGYGLSQILAPDVPPNAKIVPNKAIIEAGSIVTFSAEESKSTTKSGLNYEWQIGGKPVNENAVGVCFSQENPALTNCQFSFPGTFAISVRVKDSNGSTATAVSSVTVSLRDGYVGLILRLGQSEKERERAYRAILRAVDWTQLQQYVARPIVVFDPDRQTPVFAVSIGKSASSVEIDNDAFRGIKLIVPQFSREARELIETSIAKLGGTVVPMPFGEIAMSVKKGLANSAFVPMDSPEEYRKFLHRE